MPSTTVDALIGCVDAKYFYWFIQPPQADPAIPLPIGLPTTRRIHRHTCEAPGSSH
jgi:hypothetical protein